MSRPTPPAPFGGDDPILREPDTEHDSARGVESVEFEVVDADLEADDDEDDDFELGLVTWETSEEELDA